MSFKEALGDIEACRQLEALCMSRRIPHAVVFECSNARLAFAAAQELSAAFLCESDKVRPCGACSGCRKVYGGVHPDVYTVKIAGAKQAAGVGEIREMISDCFIKPNEGRGKVYRIFDKMTPEAQNALLKILEEPPQSALFIITAEKSTLLLKTVLSRSTLFKLGGGGDENIEAYEIAVKIARAIPQNIELPLLAATSEIAKSRELAADVLDDLEEFFTMSLEEKYIGEGGYPDYITSMTRMLRRDSIVKLFDVISHAREMLSHNCNMTVLAAWLCANIREARH